MYFTKASFIASRTYSMFKKQSEVRAEQTAMIDEYIGNHKTVVAFGREDEGQAEFDEINDRLGKCSLRALFFSSTTNPTTRFVNNLVYAGSKENVRLTMVNGKILYENGAFFVGEEPERVYAEANAFVRRLKA